MANSNSSLSANPAGSGGIGKSRGSSAAPAAGSERWIRPCRTHSSRIANGLSMTVATPLLRTIRDRHPAVTAKCTRRNLHARRRLPPLVFIGVDHPDDAASQLLVETHIDDLRETAILFHVSLQNRIKNLVCSQRIRVQLIWT